MVFRRGFLETVREIRQAKFPVVFNQHGGPTSALLTYASGSSRRVCWKGYQFSFLYNVLVPDTQEFFGGRKVHTAEHRISQLWWTGLPRGPIPNARVYPQSDAIAKVSETLRSRHIEPGEPYAVVQPGARMESMRWPITKFADIARWLQTQHGIRSVVNLGRRDEQLAAEVRATMGSDAVVIDSFNARELIALLAGARLFFGNDSGPAHIAAAMAKPSETTRVIASASPPICGGRSASSGRGDMSSPGSSLPARG